MADENPTESGIYEVVSIGSLRLRFECAACQAAVSMDIEKLNENQFPGHCPACSANWIDPHVMGTLYSGLMQLVRGLRTATELENAKPSPSALRVKFEVHD